MFSKTAASQEATKRGFDLLDGRGRRIKMKTNFGTQNSTARTEYCGQWRSRLRRLPRPKHQGAICQSLEKKLAQTVKAVQRQHADRDGGKSGQKACIGLHPVNRRYGCLWENSPLPSVEQVSMAATEVGTVKP